MNTASKAAAIIATVAVILAALACGGTSAVSFEDDSGLTYELNQAGRTATVTGHDGSVGGSLVIPSTVTYNGAEYRVTAIGESAFEGADMTSVEIPDTVKSIGDYAFFDCAGLTSVILPASLEAIGDDAFRQTSLASADFKAAGSLKTIGDYAFFGLDIATVELPDSVTTLGEEAFGENDAVQEFTLPASLSGYKASFAGCDSLTAFVKGSNTHFSVTSGILLDSAGKVLHQYPAGKEGDRYTIGSGVDEIADKAFLGCRLVNVTIPSGVTDIGVGAFAECGELTTISVNSSNRNYSSEDGVLFNKTSTRSKTVLVCYPAGKEDQTYLVPSGITTIRSMAFYGAGVSEVVLPDTLDSIGSDAFARSSLTGIQLNQGLETVGVGAFSECASLRTVTIPSTVHTLEEALAMCTALESVVWTGGTGTYTLGDYALYGCTSLASVVLPDNLRTIGYAALADCTSLQTIALPTGLTAIGDYAMGGSGLTDVVIPEGVRTVGVGAFEGCMSLAGATLPSTMGEIPDEMFFGCGSLTEVRFAEEVPDVWGDYAFGSAGFTEVTIPEGVRSLGYGTFSYCESLTEVTIPASLTDAGEFPFFGCSSLKVFAVSGDSDHYSTADGVLMSKDQRTLVVYTAGSGADEYSVPEGVRSIADGAFGHADSLEVVHIPESVVTIGAWAFCNCTGISQITVASVGVTVGEGAFALSEDSANPVEVEVFTDGEPFSESAFGGAVTVTYGALKNYGVRETSELMGDALIWVAVAVVLGVVFLAASMAGRKG